MVSRAAAKREAEFLGSEVPDESTPPSPSMDADSPTKRKRGRPPKHRGAPDSAASPTSSPARTVPPTPSSSSAAGATATKPSPTRPAVNGKPVSLPPTPAPIASKPTPPSLQKRAAPATSDSGQDSEQMSRQTSGRSDSKGKAPNGQASEAEPEEDPYVSEDDDELEPAELQPQEAQALLRVLQSLDAPSLLDGEPPAGGSSLRQLLSADRPIPIADVEAHILSLPRDGAPSQPHTLALSLLHARRPREVEHASTSTPPSPAKRRKTGGGRKRIDETPPAPGPASAAPRPTYVLHRYLEAPSGGPLGLAGSLGSGTDIFTAASADLDDEALAAAATLRDTDLVALQPPRGELRAFRKSLIDPGLLKDLAPPVPATRKEERSLRKRGRKTDNAVGAGTHVTPLYYNAYSSFAPTYDSELATLTPSATSTAALSRERMRAWRASTEPVTLPYADDATTLNLSLPERMGLSLGRTLAEVAPADAKAAVDAELVRNANLLRRLQHRQLDRLRQAVGTGSGPTHLTSGLRVPAASPSEAGRDEQAEAASLETSLGRLVQLARPALGVAEFDLVPHPPALQRAQRSLAQTSQPVVRGALGLISSRAVREGMLTSERDLAPLYPNAAPPPAPTLPQQQQPQQHGQAYPQRVAPQPTGGTPVGARPYATYGTGRPASAAYHDNSSAIRAAQQAAAASAAR